MAIDPSIAANAGMQANPAPAPQDPNAANYQRMMMALALMGAGGAGGGQNSFAGGLSQGLSPLVRQMMMQKMMQGMQPQMPQAPAAPPQQSPVPAQP